MAGMGWKTDLRRKLNPDGRDVIFGGPSLSGGQSSFKANVIFGK